MVTRVNAGTQTDVVVVGGGSGGIGAALAASRLGLNVVLLEADARLGGTAVQAGVSVWEMGAGGTGIPFDIYRRLKAVPEAVGIYSFGRHCCWPRPDEPYTYPGGESLIDPQRRYTDTLRRHGAGSLQGNEAYAREHWHGVPFEPFTYARVVTKMLRETGRCDVRTGCRVVGAHVEGGVLHSLELSSGERVVAPLFVDSSGDVVVARLCGCETMSGQEPRSRFDEPDAPEEPADHLNATTLIYRVTPTAEEEVQPLPDGIPPDCWWRPRYPSASITQFPCTDLHVNMLPTMEGRETLDLGIEAAYAECRRRILAHWHWLQSEFAEFRSYRLTWIAPRLGLRETQRVVGGYVLREQDLLAGCAEQRHPDTIAIADHSMDTHGHSTGRAGCGEVKAPYGIPYRCLLPLGVDNLLVACRGASFSSLAASSCRLSRTMMQLGQAAGTAAWLSTELGLPPADVPPTRLRDELRAQHAQVDWPTPPELLTHLGGE